MSKVSIPKGTRDFSPLEVKKRNYIINKIREKFELFGFSQIETPSFENTSTLMGKYGEEGDKLIFKILNSGDFLKKISEQDFQEANLKSISQKISEKALRYDLTIPFARYFVMNKNEITLPFKRFQIQPVWRADRPQKGRFREFYQCDADVIGAYSLWQEVELVNLYQEVFLELGVDICIKLNNRKILVGILEVINKENLFHEFTTVLDKSDKIGPENVLEELHKIGFNKNDISVIKMVLETRDLETLKQIIKSSEIGLEGIDEMQFLFDNCDRDNIIFDVTLARGLNYYTGTILEVKSTSVDIGSIGGGGRYDNLTGVFGVKDISGVGISFGLDRIFIVVEELDLFPKDISNSLKVMMINFGEKEAKECFKLSKYLRKNNIPCEMYPTPSKIKKQMDYASKREVNYVIMIGEEEINKGVLSIKNMKTGEQRIIKKEDIFENIQ